MTFKKPSTVTGVASRACTSAETDIWAIFRALRDSRAVFGLRPGHIQTLQAMLSFLKPGHGETVFASNASICRRVGGIDERTLRRHINRFVELGFIKRNDSSNRKRYRIRSSGGSCISFGLSLTPLLKRATEFAALAREIEIQRQDRIYLRKQILTRLSHLEADHPQHPVILETRRILRRKLELEDYRALLAKIEAECQHLSTVVDMPETIILPDNDGQTVRHQSRSYKENNDFKKASTKDPIDRRALTSVCDQAMSFTGKDLSTWHEIEDHAWFLAPMMGIDPGTIEKAQKSVGPRKAACAVFIVLQLGNRIRDFGAYFHSITIGQRRSQFDPASLINRLSATSLDEKQCPPRWTHHEERQFG